MDTDLLRSHAPRGTVVALPPSTEREMSAYTGAKIAGAAGPAEGFDPGDSRVLVQAGAGKTITSFFITNKHAANVLEFRLDLLEAGGDEPDPGVDDGDATVWIAKKALRPGETWAILGELQVPAGWSIWWATTDTTGTDLIATIFGSRDGSGERAS